MKNDEDTLNTTCTVVGGRIVMPKEPEYHEEWYELFDTRGVPCGATLVWNGEKPVWRAVVYR